jgi:hypothetical protein
MNHIALRVRVMEDLLPLVREDRVLVDVLEDLYLISAPVNIKSVLVSHECVVCSCLGDYMKILGWLPDLVPLLFLDLVLEEIVEVSSSFASIPSEEV